MLLNIDMIETLISSKTRIKILLNFFLNCNNKSLGVDAANTKHPLFVDIRQTIRRYIEINTIIENLISQLRQVEEICLTGTLAKGLNSNNISLEFVGVIVVK